MASNIQVTLAATLFESLDNTVTNILNSGTSKMMSQISPIFCSGLCIYFGLKALGWYRNGVDLPILDVLEEATKLTLICFLSFNVGNYLRYIVPIINGLGDDICRMLSNNTTTANTIDALLSDMINLFVDFINHPDFSSISFFSDFNVIITAIAAVICIVMLGLPFVIITCSILFTTYIGLKLFLILGPLFIALAVFPATRDMFWGWAKLICSLILINILFSLVCTIEIQFIRDHFLNKQALPNWGDLGGMILVFGCFIYLAKAIPSFAGAIAGSHGASSIGLPGGGAASGMMRGGGKLAGKAGKYATGKAYNTVQAAYNRVRGSFKPG
ncbi:type IV secretion system protein [Salmonella enterica subsp. enterica serovar Catumagos]